MISEGEGEGGSGGTRNVPCSNWLAAARAALCAFHSLPGYAPHGTHTACCILVA